MNKLYKPYIDNYLLSIPPEPEELWRNELQFLCAGMKLSVVDPIVINGQYYDVHDEFSDSYHQDFDMTEAETIVGLRKIMYAELLPPFLKFHRTFFNLVERLSPKLDASSDERLSIAREIIGVHKTMDIFTSYISFI